MAIIFNMMYFLRAAVILLLKKVVIKPLLFFCVFPVVMELRIKFCIISGPKSLIKPQLKHDTWNSERKMIKEPVSINQMNATGLFLQKKKIKI